MVGASVELWDVDVIEARKIHAYNDETDELTLAGPFSTDPQDFANYMVGESNREAKPVSVTSVAGSGDYKRTLSFIEYNETIFDPVNVQETPLYTDPVRRIGHVQDLRVYEELSMRSGSLTSNIIAAWNAPTEGDYAGARCLSLAMAVLWNSTAQPLPERCSTTLTPTWEKRLNSRWWRMTVRAARPPITLRPTGNISSKVPAPCPPR
ncbi:hypothetical protein HSBAA_29630 [Vreelandella sulfidaeris]|uniref:Uncharacterized protein n=1 Tax=Vreelandella sulfidaeris TaxID=115553 RepID=A0A455U801_9GAMM|nr:hypothetical protein HSBAA_29630 [Halomonas sulfidaeris]